MADIFRFDGSGIVGALGTVTTITDSSGNGYTATPSGSGTLSYANDGNGVPYWVASDTGTGLLLLGTDSALRGKIRGGSVTYFAMQMGSAPNLFETLTSMEATGLSGGLWMLQAQDSSFPDYNYLSRYNNSGIAVGRFDKSEFVVGAYTTNITSGNVDQILYKGNVRVGGNPSSSVTGASGQPYAIGTPSDASGFFGSTARWYHCHAEDTIPDEDTIFANIEAIRTACDFAAFPITEPNFRHIMMVNSIGAGFGSTGNHTGPAEVAIANILSLHGRSLLNHNISQIGASWSQGNTIAARAVQEFYQSNPSLQFVISCLEDINTIKGGAPATDAKTGFETFIATLRAGILAAGYTFDHLNIINLTAVYGAIASAYDSVMDTIASARITAGVTTTGATNKPDAISDQWGVHCATGQPQSVDTTLNYHDTPGNFLDNTHYLDSGYAISGGQLTPILYGFVPAPSVPVTTAPTVALSPAADGVAVTIGTVTNATSYDLDVDGTVTTSVTSPVDVPIADFSTSHEFRARGVNGLGNGPWSAYKPLGGASGSGGIGPFVDRAGADYVGSIPRY